MHIDFRMLQIKMKKIEKNVHFFDFQTILHHYTDIIHPNRVTDASIEGLAAA